MLTLEAAAAVMGMKAHKEVVNVAEHPNGTLVTTFEGAKTLIKPDGTTVPVLPGSPVLNVTGRGGVNRFANQQQPGPPIRVEASVGAAITVSPPSGEVPTGSAADVLAWVNGDVEKARQALDAETRRENPRAGLTAQLEKLVG